MSTEVPSLALIRGEGTDWVGQIRVVDSVGPALPTRPCAASSTELPPLCLCCSTPIGMGGGETFVEDASTDSAALRRLRGAGLAGWTRSACSACSTSGFSFALRSPHEPMVSRESLVRIGENPLYCAAGYPCWGRLIAPTGAMLHSSNDPEAVIPGRRPCDVDT